MRSNYRFTLDNVNYIRAIAWGHSQALSKLNNNGYSMALVHAVERGNFRLINQIVATKATIPSYYAGRALKMAMLYQPSAITLLLNAFSQLKIDEALMFSVENNLEQAVQIILTEKGNILDQSDLHIALTLADTHQHRAIYEIILEKMSERNQNKAIKPT